MTWVNGSGEEGGAAIVDAIEITSGSFSVTPKAAPPAATGWYVYVGPGPNEMVLQNAMPLGLNEVWLPEGELKQEGRTAGSGQSATFKLPAPRVLPRG